MINGVSNLKHVTILGGGLAGLAAGHYAKKNKIAFTIYESDNHIGGFSSTFERNDFHFDLGAHLFRDEILEVTLELKELLGTDLITINLPIQTYCKGKLVDFPFSPLNLIRNFGILPIIRASLEILKQKFVDYKSYPNLENFVVKAYGKSLAKLLILDYSSKLWGRPCNELSPDASGNKLRGLDIKTLLKEILPHKIKKKKNTGATLYYPQKGIGMIAEKLSEPFIDKIQINSKITKIFHDNTQIRMLEINNKEKVVIDQLFSTIPINIFLQIMDPKPPLEILNLANSLIFRDMILVVILLNKDSITKSASIHFTDPDLAVTRIHEPKKRSEKMAPSGKSSLVVEIPCSQNDKIWKMEDQEIIHLVSTRLDEIYCIGKKEIIDTFVFKLKYAYPVLDVDYKWKMNKIRSFLDKFSNLRMAGRNSTFTYTSMHNIIRSSKKIIEKYIS